MKHAKLGPSSWDRWSNCPGSVTLCEGQPNTTSRYAAEGSVAHEIADRVLRGEIGHAGALLDTMFQQEGYDILVDEEMVEAVTLYVQIVRDHTSYDGTLFPEQRLPIGHMTGETDAEGTSDAVIFDQGRMTVVDLKYGKGVRVNAEGNGQGRMYALGALQKFAGVYEINDVEIMIVQPRIEDGISSEILTIGELEEHRDIVELAAARTVIDDTLVPGEKQCKFCPAKGICPALKAETSNSLALLSPVTAADFADLTMPKQAASIELSPDIASDKLAEFLRAVPLIEAAISGVRAEVERRLFDNQTVPGFYLGEGRKGNRKWVDGVEIELKKRLGAAAYEKKLIGVPAAEKAFKAKPRTWAKIKDLIVQAEGKPSVCADGDKNKPYTPVTADHFADLSVETEAQQLLS